MTFGAALKTCLRKFFVFSGRASRAEFWWFVFLYIMLCLTNNVLIRIVRIIGHTAPSLTLTLLAALTLESLVAVAILIPLVAAQTRRLHDVGYSGWWLLVCVGLWLAGGLLVSGAAPHPAMDGHPAIPVNVILLWSGIAVGGTGTIGDFWLLFKSACRGQSGANKYGTPPAVRWGD
jgi:uncharacterized membrane protein YhaH (DUF805 family)